MLFTLPSLQVPFNEMNIHDAFIHRLHFSHTPTHILRILNIMSVNILWNIY